MHILCLRTGGTLRGNEGGDQGFSFIAAPATAAMLLLRHRLGEKRKR